MADVVTSSVAAITIVGPPVVVAAEKAETMRTVDRFWFVDEMRQHNSDVSQKWRPPNNCGDDGRLMAAVVAIREVDDRKVGVGTDLVAAIVWFPLHHILFSAWRLVGFPFRLRSVGRLVWSIHVVRDVPNRFKLIYRHPQPQNERICI